MLLGAEIAMVLCGLYSLVTGKFQLTGKRTVTGGYARVAGCFLLLPVPIAMVLGFIIGSVAELQIQLQRRSLSITVLEVILVVTGLILAYVVAFSAPRD